MAFATAQCAKKILKALYKHRVPCYNNLAKQTKYADLGCVFPFWGYLYPFLTILFYAEFDKMQIPRMREYLYTQSVYGLFGDNRNLRFCALTSVGALFILEEFFMKIAVVGSRSIEDVDLTPNAPKKF